MAVVPTGAPFWLRANDHATYGGHTDKRNYESQGAVNPRTDITAEEFARLVDDIARLGLVAPFAVLTVRTNDAVPAAPTVLAYDAAAGAAPTLARVADGSFTATWAAAYSDSYSVSADLDLRHVTASTDATGSARYTLSDPDANGKNERIQVAAYDMAGVAVQDVTITVVVWPS